MNCPKCGAPELNPETGLLNIRANKILIDGYWESHAMCCSIWFNELGQVTEECGEGCYCREMNHAPMQS